MTGITKAESQAIQQQAQALVSEFGIERLDAMTVPAAKHIIIALTHQLRHDAGLARYEPARQHIARACRRLRHGTQPEDNWGGARR